MTQNPENLIWMPDDPVIAVRNVIPRNGMWSGNNQLGIEQGFAPDTNNRQSILKLDEWGPPDIWTIMLGIVIPNDVTSYGFEVLAELEIGVGGATQQVQVDWNQGVALSAPMNALNVIANYGEFQTSVPDGLRLRVTLARGALARGRPTRTFNDIISAGGSTGEIMIPPFSRRVFVLGNADIYGATSTLTFFKDPTNTAPADIIVQVMGNNLPSFSEGVPIPGGAHAWRLSNGGALAAKASIIFELAF